MVNLYTHYYFCYCLEIKIYLLFSIDHIFRYPEEPTAADVLNTLDVPSLVKIFKIYGEERNSKKVAQALFDARYMLKSIKTTFELADLVHSTLGR